MRLRCVATLFIGALLASDSPGEEKFYSPPSPDAPGLVAFWNFQEPAGERFASSGPRRLELREMDGPIERAREGVFGGRSVRIRPGQWLRIPRGELGPLDIHGPEARVTVVAWIKRESPSPWQAVAGVWDETHSKRQYMLFLNARAMTDSRTLERVPCRDRVHGHVSAVGGPTPGHEVCKTYASGATPVPQGEWTMIAMTYDGQFSRVYVDGVLDAEEHFNPFPYPDGLFNGGEDGAEFTVGANHVAGLQNNNRFGGLIGGLAVFDRALTEEEMRRFAPQRSRPSPP